MTNGERKALAFLAAVGALGGVARVVASPARAPTRAERLALQGQLAAVDSAREAGGGATRPGRRAGARMPRRRRADDAQGAAVTPAPRRVDAPDGAVPPAPVDLDAADAAAIEALPGIGPALARRIVEDRAARGPFGSIDALQRVRGVGPKLAARVAPHVTFSGVSRPFGAAVVRPP